MITSRTDADVSVATACEPLPVCGVLPAVLAGLSRRRNRAARQPPVTTGCPTSLFRPPAAGVPGRRRVTRSGPGLGDLDLGHPDAERRGAARVGQPRQLGEVDDDVLGLRGRAVLLGYRNGGVLRGE